MIGVVRLADMFVLIVIHMSIYVKLTHMDRCMFTSCDFLELYVKFYTDNNAGNLYVFSGWVAV